LPLILLAGVSASAQSSVSSSRSTKFVEAVPQMMAANTPPQQFSFTPALRSSSKPERFQWKRAVLQSANFMAIQQGIMFATDNWTRYQVSHGKWFKTYMRAVRGNTHWDDGDPTLDNYVGHPMQGAITGYIQIQNDPAGSHLEFANSRSYWKSRLKAMAWNAAYSAQFEIGPFGEASIQKLGSYQYRNCVPGCRVTNGAGLVDFVITPAVGTGWVIGEDLLDKAVPAKLEKRFGRNGWTNLVRCLVNPTRTAANILNHKRPWYRASRDDVR
jgi:hypothetical protein